MCEKLLKREKEENSERILIGLIEDTARISVFLKKLFRGKKFGQFARRTNSQMENVYKGWNKYGKWKNSHRLTLLSFVKLTPRGEATTVHSV